VRLITEATATLSAAVAASSTTLTDLDGIGDVIAAKILARRGAISRFRSASAFASCCGVAPIEVSSGDIRRHRLSRAGDRQLHVMAMAQNKRVTRAGDQHQRKRVAGKTHKEAMRCLKRRLANVVYRTMISDRETSLLSTPCQREVPLAKQTCSSR
jgi:transposase